MIADLKPYPAYKDSGVEWLGDVPEHWEVRTLAQFGKLSKGCGGNKDDEVAEGVPCVRYGDLYTTHDHCIRKSRSFVSKGNAAEYTTIRFGDVLFAGSGETIDEIGKSAVNLMQTEACCGGDVIVFRPSRQVDARYLGYATDCRPAVVQKATMGRGITVMHIYGTQLKRLTLPLPPLPEQTAIVRYLDHADRRIRRYIRAKEKLITLLEEQKQAIIHQAVTGQIDVRTGLPYPAYKPSGVEWLGDVPEHWELRRVKYAVSFTGGGTPSKAAATFWSGHIPWVSPKDMTRAQLNDTADHITNDAVAASATSIVAPGAVLIVVRSGILRRTIPVAINTVPMALNQDMKALRPKDGIAKSEYLLVLIQGNESFLLREWTKHGATVESIEHGFLANSRVPLPPLPEQADIVRFLDGATAKMGAAIDRAGRQIHLLREYRTRLIADVVTGKLDVREAAAGLPEVDPPAGELDALTTQAAETGMMELGDATETPEELAMENEVTI